jgi:hypothetical protein
MKPYAEGGPTPPMPRKRNPAAGAGDVTPPPGKDGKPMAPPEFKKYAKGGSVSASRRADGCAQRGKTKGRMV